jgi:hypothetical protein
MKSNLINLVIYSSPIHFHVSAATPMVTFILQTFDLSLFLLPQHSFSYIVDAAILARFILSSMNDDLFNRRICCYGRVHSMLFAKASKQVWGEGEEFEIMSVN